MFTVLALPVVLLLYAIFLVYDRVRTRIVHRVAGKITPATPAPTT